MKLVDDVTALLRNSPQTEAVMELAAFDGFAQLAGALFARLCQSPAVGGAVQQAYGNDAELVKLTVYDIAETARRNFEPGGAAATLLFSRGVHAIMGHRVAHKLWTDGEINHALALKAAFGRAFSTDIHPAAQIGAGLWLDHGLGFVVGETAVIGKDVSIWHNVTLGSSLNDSGPHRHPHLGDGVVIGAGATLLGGITVGAGANIAAGAIVVADVPAQTLAVGAKATLKGPAKVSFERDKD